MYIYTKDYVLNTIRKNKDKIKDCKVTTVKDVDFNTLVGYTYIVGIKLVLVNGKSKLYKITFNSTHLDDETPREYAESWLESCFNL